MKRGRLGRNWHWGALALLVLPTIAGSFYFRTYLGFRIFSGLLIVPYLICIPLLLRVVVEYEPGSLMRLAWLLMLHSAWVSVIRHVLDFASSFFMGGTAMELRSFSLVAADASLVLQLLAVVLLWYCFRPLGIGRPFTWVDWSLVGLVAVLVVFCFSEVRFFPHSAAAHAFFRDLELLNPALFAAIAVVGLLLYRLSMDIGSGNFSLAILFLMFEFFARFIAFSLQVLGRHLASSELTRMSNVFYWSYPLFFLWAILLRWQMIGDAAETARIQHYEKLEMPMMGTALGSMDEMHHEK